MKIIKEYEGVMVIKDSSLVFYLVGAIFFVLGLIVIIKPETFSNKPPVYAGIFAVVIGLISVLAAKSTTITIDKATQKITRKIKSLISDKTTEYGFDLVKKIRMREIISHTYNRNGSSNNISYKLSFVIGTGEEIDFTPGTASSFTINGYGSNPDEVIGKKISVFLNIPFEGNSAPTIQEIITDTQAAIKNLTPNEPEIKQ